MITSLKNKKRQIAIAFFALLPLVFFCFLKMESLSDVFTPGQKSDYNLEKELNSKNSSQNYAELEISDSRNEATPNSYDRNDDVNNEKNSVGTLSIPKIKVDTNIQSVGLNSKNEMGVPNNDWDVAWYNLGTKPGEKGSAVIAGHLDGRTGKPAVFWGLDKLEIGDYIYVIDNENIKKSFQIISLKKYEIGTAPMEKIFGANDGAYLNLITCGGVWDKTKNNYSERFVVFAKYIL